MWMWVASRPLVPVGSTPRGASTSGLSTTCSAWGLQRLGAAWNPYLGEGFPLRCFQRLSLPNVANRPRHWRDDRHTRGSSTQVLSYYGQASSRIPTSAEDRDQTVSRRFKPSSRTSLNGEQPYPWDRLQPQDEMSRHRGAKHRRRYELLGGISLLSPEYLLSVERWPFHTEPPDH